MLVLALFSAYGGAAIGLVQAGVTLAQLTRLEEHGLAGALPELASALLQQTGARPELVAVVVGPGSFTGLRAGLALAQGLAMGSAIPAVGVTVGEAMAHAAADAIGERELWTAIVARRGRVFIEIGAVAQGYAELALPPAPRPVAVCGNAANLVAAHLAARGGDVMLMALHKPACAAIAEVALQRWRGERPALPLLPLYVDAPEARLPKAAPMQPHAASPA